MLVTVNVVPRLHKVQTPDLVRIWQLLIASVSDIESHWKNV